MNKAFFIYLLFAWSISRSCFFSILLLKLFIIIHRKVKFWSLFKKPKTLFWCMKYFHFNTVHLCVNTNLFFFTLILFHFVELNQYHVFALFFINFIIINKNRIASLLLSDHCLVQTEIEKFIQWEWWWWWCYLSSMFKIPLSVLTLGNRINSK